jgi:hypothetical protein
LPDGFLGKLLTPVIGGLLAGCLCVAAPLCLGDGGDQVKLVLAYTKQLGLATVIVSGLVKLFCVGICLGFGFVGGPIFPIIFSGACAAAVVNVLIPQIPALITYTCCILGFVACFLPGIFTLTTMASVGFVLGPVGTSIVFVAVIMSYSTVCGMGLVQNVLVRLSQGKPVDDEEEDLSQSTIANPLLQEAYSARLSLTSSLPVYEGNKKRSRQRGHEIASFGPSASQEATLCGEKANEDDII